MNIKQKNEEKKNFIFRALQRGYLVKKNNNGTYTFTRPKCDDEPLKNFVNKCNIKLNFTNFK